MLREREEYLSRNCRDEEESFFFEEKTHSIARANGMFYVEQITKSNRFSLHLSIIIPFSNSPISQIAFPTIPTPFPSFPTQSFVTPSHVQQYCIRYSNGAIPCSNFNAFWLALTFAFFPLLACPSAMIRSWIITTAIEVTGPPGTRDGSSLAMRR